MNKTQSLIKYFTKKYPQYEKEFILLFNGVAMVTFPSYIFNEINVFVAAMEEGYDKGYWDASNKASEEYTKNIHEIVNQVHSASFNEGYTKGYESGKNQELINSPIPSDAYDIEVFAVQPSNHFETGKQAFIGFKVDMNEQSQFHFIQVQFSAPNLTVKSKINVNEPNQKISS